MERSPIDRLLDELCTDLGLCLPESKRSRLEAHPRSDVDRLTEAIFLGEGLDPRRVDKALWRGVHSRVAARFHTLLDPAITQDIGPVLQSLSSLGVHVVAACYDERSFGNYYVDCVLYDVRFRIIRDRLQYLIDAPVEQLQALGIFRAFDSRDELGTAVRAYIHNTTIL